MLRDLNFDVTVSAINALSSEELLQYACVAIIPDESDVQRVLDLPDSMRDAAQPPWIIIFGALKSLQSRTQTSAVNQSAEICNAISQGVRMHHGRMARSPFNVFLSYRRPNVGIARAVNRSLPSWWDQHTLSPGVDWASEIELGIRDCALFVALLKGDVPLESYTWRELDLAIKHQRSIAILAFEEEGDLALSKCGINRAMLEWCELKRPKFQDEEPFLVGRHSGGARSVLYFGQLGKQLGWPLRDGDAESYSTPRASSLLSTLTDFPKYRFYSSDPWIPVWDLMKPIGKS